MELMCGCVQDRREHASPECGRAPPALHPLDECLELADVLLAGSVPEGELYDHLPAQLALERLGLGGAGFTRGPHLGARNAARSGASS